MLHLGYFIHQIDALL